MTELENILAGWGRAVKKRSERKARKAAGLAQPPNPYYCDPQKVADYQAHQAKQFPEARELPPRQFKNEDDLVFDRLEKFETNERERLAKRPVEEEQYFLFAEAAE